ncbi:MAG TPA: GIY-YIG nuclease family protein [Candidatus Moranbacteria bacterium]|nr:GIY-YIG nuclease family protein [Candidatus Moranbacteria bacterium]
METSIKKLKSLPQSPGVYIFKNKAGNILYVGKAGSLKDRVGSYFQNRDGYARPIEIYISEVTDLEIRKTDTVLEAYILEQSLIKKYQPKYNMMSKDDKSFCYVVVIKEDFPRFMIMRKTELKDLILTLSLSRRGSQKEKIYGPYTSKKQIETVLKILRKIFPYHAKPQKTEKGCLDYHIGLCPGPYDGAISKKDYQKNIRAIRMILEGKKSGLVKKMKKEMLEHSDNQDYERAAKLRNQMFALQHVQDIALINNEFSPSPLRPEDRTPPLGQGKMKLIRIEGYDISNISGKYSVGSMVVFDNSEGEIKSNKNQYRKFKIKTVEGANDVGAMEEVLMRRFRNNWALPNLIILDGGRGHLNMARRVLRVYHLDIPILAVAKGLTRKKLDFCFWGSVPKIPKNIIEQIRNEAHRFAIKYHRDLRSREAVKTFK